MRSPDLAPAERALSPVVGKTLELGLLVLFVAALSGTFYGGIVPEYRADSASAVGERTLAAASLEVQAAVPPNGTDGTVRRRVDLPPTLGDDDYAVTARNGTLVVTNASVAVDPVPLALPDRVRRVEGTWHSREAAWVLVEPVPGGYVVRLASGGAP
jgi:hypothetical protein